MELRPARPDDLDAIAEIHDQAIREGAIAFIESPSREEDRAWLADRPASRPVIVAERDGEVVGWASLSDYRPGRQALRQTAEVSYFVHRDHRRKGVASALVRHCFEIAPGLGVRVLVAILLDENEASIALLEKLGFARWGELPRVARFEDREVGHVYYGRRVP